ncbi:hypothetical protein HDV01_000513 [Terramyces sp. JEL0728]|nr:hypothetical protein HDV01_000513 [Terramyces sp. JEL0728]
MGDDFDVDKYLRLETNEYKQEEEVERIMKLIGNQDPCLILDLPTEVYLTLDIPEKLVTKIFRKKSLLVHPDKCKHPNARAAFEELQKAQNLLLNEPEKKQIVLNYIDEARANILHIKGVKIPPKGKPFDYKALQQEVPNIGRLIQLEFLRMAMELAYRDRTRLKNEQEREMLYQDELAKKQKANEEWEKTWEETRDNRIGSWKNYEKKKEKEKVVAKKKKKKPVVLGAIPK